MLQSVRRTRQSVLTGNNAFNLPSTYTVNLPLSCCKTGGVSNGNSVGGCKYLLYSYLKDQLLMDYLDCVFQASNGTSSFYIDGCFRFVANIGFSQITGIAVINTVLLILAFVNFAKLITVFRANPDKNNPYNQQEQQGAYQYTQDPQGQYQYAQNPQGQYQYDPYYTNYDNQNAYYVGTDQNYKMYL